LRSAPLVLVAVLVIGGFLALILLGSGARDRAIDASTIGIDALGPWLRQQDIAVQRSNPRLYPIAETIALRIIPLYDTDLNSWAPEPATRVEAYFAPTIRDIDREDLAFRIAAMPTLIVMPKWVAGTVGSGIAHKSALVPAGDVDRLADQLVYPELALVRPARGFLTANVPDGTLALFEAQVFRAGTLPRRCASLVAVPQGVLVVRCDGPAGRGSLYLLSDPDLLNNHGLVVADNAVIVAGLVRTILAQNRTENAADTQVYLDAAPEDQVEYYESAAERRDYSRGSAEFARLFEPPLAGLWAMLLIVLGVAFWRGSVRFGPVRRAASGPEQSKIVALATNARLLRLAGHDGRMVADFVQNGLTDLSRRTFGPVHGSGPAGRDRLFAHLARRDAKAAGALRGVADTVLQRAAQMSPADLRRHLDTYRSLLEKLTHADDADRLSRPR
jgi:hypothetical protein